MHLHFDYGSGNTLGTRGKVSCVQHQQLAKKHTHIHVRTYSLNTKVYAMSEHLRGVWISSSRCSSADLRRLLCTTDDPASDPRVVA